MVDGIHEALEGTGDDANNVPPVYRGDQNAQIRNVPDDVEHKVYRGDRNAKCVVVGSWAETEPQNPGHNIQI